MRRWCILIILTCSQWAFPQVGIGTTDPNPASVLDIAATDKGLLIPRISLDDVSNTQLDGINTVPEGILIYNTNASTVGGSGAGFYFFNGTVWQLLTGTSSSGSDADWYQVGTTLPPGGNSDHIFTTGYVSIGEDSSGFPLNVDSGSEDNLVRFRVDTPGDNTQRAQEIEMTNSGSGAQVGLQVGLNKSGTGSQFGVEISLNGETEGTKTGISNSLSGNGDERFFGIVNGISGNGSERKFGVSNIITGGGTGVHNGTVNEVYSTGDGTKVGTRNIVSSGASGNHYGVTNSISGGGDAGKFGIHNTISGSSSGRQHGVFNSISNTGNNEHYGIFNVLNGAGDGRHYGSANILNANGSGIKYGTYSIVQGTGTGNKYGSYVLIPSSSGNITGGDLYGYYAQVQTGSTGVAYAAYFLGNVAFGTNTSDTYTFPGSRGTNGQILQTDGAGQLSWVNPTSPVATREALTRLESKIEEQSNTIESLRNTVLLLVN